MEDKKIILFITIGGVFGSIVLLVICIWIILRFLNGDRNDIKIEWPSCFNCLKKKEPTLREKQSKVELPRIDLAIKTNVQSFQSNTPNVGINPTHPPEQNNDVIFDSFNQSEITEYGDTRSNFVADISSSYHSLNNTNSFADQTCVLEVSSISNSSNQSE